uniref:Nuclear pore complex protein n=1 Tax=Panagrolaimus superbus TaxID=310955 RepID=A0A914Z1W8_9BILA
MDLDTRSFVNNSGVFNATNRNDSALYASQFLNAEQTDIFSEVCQSIFVDYHAICLSEASFEDIVKGFKQTAANGVQIFQRTFNNGKRGDRRIEMVLNSLEAERNIFDLIFKLYQAEFIAQHKDENTNTSLLKRFEEVAVDHPVGFSQLIKELEHIRSIDHALSHAAVQKKFAHLDSVYLKQLSDEDSQNLERIKRIFFCLLRCGRSALLKELAEQTGLSSLRAYLQVRLLLTDPDSSPLEETAESYEFAESRLNFKSTASLILSTPDNGISDTDRCIWSALTGNLDKLLPFADNPDDVLWVFTNCAIEAILDEEIIASHKMEENDIVQSGNESSPKTVNTVFSNFRTHCNDICFKIIGCLAANNFEEVVSLAYSDAILESSDINNLRLYAHLVLLIKKGTYKYDKAKGDQIIFLYSKMLVTLEMNLLVPFYLSKLEKEESIERMVDFLYEINGESRRAEVLTEAVNVGFDIGKLCVKVYEKAKLENPLDDSRKLSDSIAQRINIWRFLLISPEDTACEALIECNNLLRELFERDRYAEAMELLGHSPQNLTTQTKEFIKNLSIDDRDEAMIRRIQDQQREFNSYLLYLEIMEKFSIWKHRINEELSEMPKKISDVEYAKLDVIQKSEYERQMNHAMSRIQAHLKDCEKYQNVVVNQILDLLYQTPTFFASCLDLNDVENYEEHQARVAQLSRIHERYLYYTITMLITLYRKIFI